MSMTFWVQFYLPLIFENIFCNRTISALHIIDVGGAV